MIELLAPLLVALFALLALWHFYMALAGTGGGDSAAIPSVEGRPLFAPSRRATVAVGVALLLFAALVAGTAGMWKLGLPPRLLAWPCSALALGLLARAVGEFRYVGFFKRVRGSRFARMDTLLYSPLCLLLGLGVATVAAGAVLP